MNERIEREADRQIEVAMEIMEGLDSLSNGMKDMARRIRQEFEALRVHSRAADRIRMRKMLLLAAEMCDDLHLQLDGNEPDEDDYISEERRTA